VVLVDGMPVGWFDRRSRHLIRLDASTPAQAWATALADCLSGTRAGTGRSAALEIRRHDGGAVGNFDEGLRTELLSCGFVDTYRSMKWRPEGSVRGVK
jgi:hypothetical protein